MSWKSGQAPVYVWLERKAVGAEKYGKVGSRLCVGQVRCRTMEPTHEPGKWVCYKLVPSKSRIKK